MKAAGRTLTVGELREALAGLDDMAFLYVDGEPIEMAHAWGDRVHLSTGRDESDEDEDE